MPTKIVLAPGYEVIAKESLDDVLNLMKETPSGGHFPIVSTQGGRVLVNPAHITLIGEEPGDVTGGPFGLGTLPPP